MRRRTILTLAGLIVGPAWGAEKRSALAAPLVVVIVGAPGSGKTIQAGLLARRYGLPSIAVADLLRAGLGKRRGEPVELAAGVASGDLAGDELANNLVKTRITQRDASNGFILDGYPRTAEQARFLDDHLQSQGWPKPRVVVLNVADDVVRRRLAARGRVDDRPEWIERRLQEFHADFEFLSQWYTADNLLSVDAGQSIPQVERQVVNAVEEAMARRSFAVR